MCLYRLLAYVKGHLAFQDVEAFILEVMDVVHAVALRSEYLYQRVPSVGLLPRSFYGGQCPKLPPRFPFARVVCEGPACG